MNMRVNKVSDTLMTSINDDFINIWGDDPFNPDKLLDELRSFYEPTGPLKMPILRHPLVYQVPLFHSWKMANESYIAKSELLEKYLLEGKPEYAIWLYERPYRLIMFIHWFFDDHRLSLAQARLLLPEVWRDAELPYASGRDSLCRLFKTLGFVSDCDLSVEALPDSFTLFRGSLARHKRGLSWTRSGMKAAWFASRFNRRGNVYSTIATPDMVLAVFNSRGEREVLLDYRKIKDIILEQERVEQIDKRGYLNHD